MARNTVAAERGIAAAPQLAVGKTYDAFISYSQRGDKAVARALRTVIQTVGKPWWKVRNLNVFLDATSLSAAPGLWDSIAARLDRSRYLVLLASREAAASHWVDKEVAHFIGDDFAGLDRVLIGLTDGDLCWDATAGDFAWDERTPLPPSLRGRFRMEPLWVDLRAFRAEPVRATKSDQQFLHAALDMAATIQGVEKADLFSDELQQRQRSLRLAYGAAVVVTGLAIGAGIAAWVAVEQADIARSQSEIAEAERDRAEEQARNAEKEKNRAEENLAAAKQAVDDLIVDVAGGLRTVSGMRVEIVRKILETVQATVERLAATAPDDKGLKRSQIAMYGLFTDTYLAAGAVDEARALADAGLSIARTLADADPGNADAQRDLSGSLIKVGNVMVQAGAHASAAAAFEESFTLSRSLADADPSNAVSQRDLAVSLSKIGNGKLRAGDLVGALAAYEEHLSIVRVLAAANPESAEAQRDLSVSLGRLGDVKREAGDIAGAFLAYSQCLYIDRKLAEADVGSTQAQDDLSVTLDRIGQMKLSVGDRAGALSAYEQSLTVRRTQAAVDPGNAVAQRALMIVLQRIGDLKLRDSDPDAAGAAFEESLAISRRVAASDAGNVEAQTDLVVSLTRAASLAEEPAPLYREALAILQSLNAEGLLSQDLQTWRGIVEEQIAALSDEGQTKTVAE